MSTIQCPQANLCKPSSLFLPAQGRKWAPWGTGYSLQINPRKRHSCYGDPSTSIDLSGLPLEVLPTRPWRPFISRCDVCVIWDSRFTIALHRASGLQRRPSVLIVTCILQCSLLWPIRSRLNIVCWRRVLSPLWFYFTSFLSLHPSFLVFLLVGYWGWVPFLNVSLTPCELASDIVGAVRYLASGVPR